MTRGKITLRSARVSDLLAIVRLDREAFGDGSHGTAWGVFDFARFAEVGGSIVVATRGRSLVGCAVVAFSRGRATIESIAVATRERRRGVGSALMGEVEGEARRAGCRSVSLLVAERNLGARALYEGRGYVARRRDPNAYGRGRHGLIMSRRLG